MLNFTHNIPTRIYFGRGQISHLAESLREFGTRVLLTYGGGSIIKTGLYDRVMDILSDEGFTVIECGGIEPNPRIESVERGVALCKEHDIDVILAVGGGSTIDCSKAIAAGVYFEGDDLWDMVATRHGVLKALPLVDILTLSATGSEYDGGGVISNMKLNQKLGNGYTFPAVSICDPTYTFTVSKYQTAAGTADIISHICEEYFSRTPDSDLADGICETVFKSAIRNLPIALAEPDNYEARANLMSISSIACSGIPSYGKQGSCWPCHSMEHELSAFYDITHGVGLAILTPRWMRHILKKDPTCAWRFVRFARNVWGLDGDDETALAFAGIDRLESFFRESGIPMTLSELGIGTEHFAKMAAHANRGGLLKNSFVALDDEDIIRIYTDCLN
ncbi:MAG: iron-containing alcohol dehydrogenase [Clostridia bacterium]|nr:iron-containing alcohol dehydrogenase [Clostridia bacterium]